VIGTSSYRKSSVLSFPLLKGVPGDRPKHRWLTFKAFPDVFNVNQVRKRLLQEPEVRPEVVVRPERVEGHVVVAVPVGNVAVAFALETDQAENVALCYL